MLFVCLGFCPYHWHSEPVPLPEMVSQLSTEAKKTSAATAAPGVDDNDDDDEGGFFYFLSL